MAGRGVELCVVPEVVDERRTLILNTRWLIAVLVDGRAGKIKYLALYEVCHLRNHLLR